MKIIEQSNTTIELNNHLTFLKLLAILKYHYCVGSMNPLNLNNNKKKGKARFVEKSFIGFFGYIESIKKQQQHNSPLPVCRIAHPTVLKSKFFNVDAPLF